MSAIQQVMAGHRGAGDPYWSDVIWLSSFDSSIIDESPLAQPLTVVGAASSTAQKKFGSASALFNTSVMEIHLASQVTFSGDFTIETFAYFNSLADRIFVSGNYGNCQVFRISQGASGRVSCYLNGAVISSSDGLVTASTWTHLALVRVSGVAHLYVNGTSVGSVTAPTVTLFTIGTYRYGGSVFTSDAFDGYIDEFRVTDGVARYTSDFTVPTSSFPRW